MTTAVDPVSTVVYPNIKAAAEHLTTFKRGENAAVDIAFDMLRAAYWAETPEPAESTFPTQPTE